MQPQCELCYIGVDGQTIGLTYRESPPTGANRDGLLYYYWAPLGNLAPGVYDVELYDADRKVISLMRKVEVVSGDSHSEVARVKSR